MKRCRLPLHQRSHINRFHKINCVSADTGARDECVCVYVYVENEPHKRAENKLQLKD